MHSALQGIPDRILQYAMGALTQANHHAVFLNPGNEHWGYMSVVNTAHAGELFLKAIIAKSHPLLIFKDIFNLNENNNDMDLEELMKKGKTHDFAKLPKVLWAVTGDRIPHPDIYQEMRETRNAIQHFCVIKNDRRFRRLSLEFIYMILDPLINKHFGLHAIEFHEDHDIGYDYLVGCLLSNELKFSMPLNYQVGEIDPEREMKNASENYRDWYWKSIENLK